MASVRDTDSIYGRNLAHINKLLYQHGSLSGHEANCAFLNTHGKEFATVSAVTGFDFLDDARAIALTDWDNDGDLDAWITNRTAPRVRFLQNNVPSQHHFLSLKLQGTSSNRDAIGARVTVTTIDGDRGMPSGLTRTVRAGEGFLAQSSKRLHFGLNDNDRPVTVRVIWPNGATQVLRQIAVDRHYTLTEGEEQLGEWSRPAPADKIKAIPQPTQPESDTARVRLARRLPAPRLIAERLDGSRSQEIVQLGRPTLINLWATWCQPCLLELHELAQQADAIRAAGVHVVTVNVDQAVRAEDYDAEVVHERVEQLALPFDNFSASADLLSRIQTLQQTPFATHVELPVPISLLLDEQGRVAVIYRGPLDIQMLLRDARDLTMTLAAWESSAMPSLGRWNQTPGQTSLAAILSDLTTRELVADAVEYVTQNRAAFESDRSAATLLVWLGDQLLATNKASTGLDFYRLAMTADPEHVAALNNLAWQLATNSDEQLRDGQQAVTRAEQAARLTKAQDAGVLDTLAAAYAEAGQFEKAQQAAARAIQLATQAKQADFAKRLSQRAELYGRLQPFRSTP
ncbi:MAG: ASPIC/UnbV domain-containing protein [Planctomycetales bacterium]|nr:ASPIC/UnbV domain-containing protein [Planctomycetales bacterium]